jgi:hypothetical protein
MAPNASGPADLPASHNRMTSPPVALESAEGAVKWLTMTLGCLEFRSRRSRESKLSRRGLRSGRRGSEQRSGRSRAGDRSASSEPGHRSRRTGQLGGPRRISLTDVRSVLAGVADQVGQHPEILGSKASGIVGQVGTDGTGTDGTGTDSPVGTGTAGPDGTGTDGPDGLGINSPGQFATGTGDSSGGGAGEDGDGISKDPFFGLPAKLPQTNR